MGCDSSKLLSQHSLLPGENNNNNGNKNPILFIKAVPKNPQHDAKSKGVQYLALVPMSPSFFPEPESLMQLHQTRCEDDAVLKMFCSFKNRPKPGAPELQGQTVISIEEYYRRVVTSLANSPERNPIPAVVYLWTPSSPSNNNNNKTTAPTWEQVGYIGCRTCNFLSQMKTSGEVGIFLGKKARGLSLATTIARSMCWLMNETSPSNNNNNNNNTKMMCLPPSHVEFSTRLDNRPVLDMMTTLAVLLERVRLQALYHQISSFNNNSNSNSKDHSMNQTQTKSTSNMMMTGSAGEQQQQQQQQYDYSLSSLSQQQSLELDEDILQKVESAFAEPNSINNSNNSNSNSNKHHHHHNSNSINTNLNTHNSNSNSIAAFFPFSIECSPLDEATFSARSADVLAAENLEEEILSKEDQQDILQGNFDDLASKFGLDERLKFKISSKDCEKIVHYFSSTLDVITAPNETEQLMVKMLVDEFTAVMSKNKNATDATIITPYFVNATNMPPPPLPTRDEVQHAKLTLQHVQQQQSSSSLSCAAPFESSDSSSNFLHSTTSSNFVNTPQSQLGVPINNNLHHHHHGLSGAASSVSSACFSPSKGTSFNLPHGSSSPPLLLRGSGSSMSSLGHHSMSGPATTASSSSHSSDSALPIVDVMPVWSQSVLGELIEGCRKSTELRKLQTNSKKQQPQQQQQNVQAPSIVVTSLPGEGKYQKVPNAPAPVNGFFTHQQQQSKKQLVRAHYKQQKEIKKQQKHEQKQQQQQLPAQAPPQFDDQEQTHHHHHHDHAQAQAQAEFQPLRDVPLPPHLPHQEHHSMMMMMHHYPSSYPHQQAPFNHMQHQQPAPNTRQQHHHLHHHLQHSAYFSQEAQQQQRQQQQPQQPNYQYSSFQQGHHQSQHQHQQYFSEYPMKHPPTAVFVPQQHHHHHQQHAYASSSSSFSAPVVVVTPSVVAPPQPQPQPQRPKGPSKLALAFLGGGKSGGAAPSS